MGRSPLATFAEHAERSLRTYVDRGEKLLKALKADDFDAVERLSRLRKAAFHNFAFYLDAAEKGERDRSWVAPLVDLHERASELNATIGQELTAARLRCQGELGECVRTREKIGKFRSQASDDVKKVNTTA